MIKVRGSTHSKDIRFFDIADGKTEIGERLEAHSGVLSGQAVPARRVRQV